VAEVSQIQEKIMQHELYLGVGGSLSQKPPAQSAQKTHPYLDQL